MSKKLWLLPLAVGMMALSPLVVGEEPAQKQVKQQEQVYGSQLMTREERVAYRAKMRAAKTQEEREKVRAEHHEQMKARAKERGVTLPDAPPAMGGGMSPGGGMGPGGGGMGPGGGMGGGAKGR
jgi:hypothetical protein